MSTETLILPSAQPVAATSAEISSQKKKTSSASSTWKAFKGILKKSDGVILPLLILAVWETVTQLHYIKPVFLPSPQEVVGAFYQLLVHDRLLTDIWFSGFVVLQGFALGSLIGLVTGVLTGLSKSVERFLGPTLDTIRQVPTLAWLPLIILWAGAGNLGKVVLLTKVVFFPVFLNTLQGIRGVSKEYIEVGQIFGYSRQLLLRRIILPAALPSLFVGIRLGAGLAWAMIIASEMLAGRYGLGFLLHRAQEMLLTRQLFVVIFVIGVIGFVVDKSLRRIEKHLLRWKKGFEG